MYQIERLARRHDRSTFSCGIEALDDYLIYYALQNDKKRIATAYVILEGKRVIGYYTLSNASVTLSDLPEAIAKKLPAYPVPAIRIGRFAIDQSLQRRGVGEQLLTDALLRVFEASKISAVFAVIVDAKSQSVKFYKRYGFIQSQHHPQTLFLPVRTIIEALK